ncbi:MAG: trypsin-like peptidase domain-containing protein [Puniceicoccales bacterium]|nr:trypsin-like peptidase domain-containing protein [Puniceicoccales bacterium]
MLALGFQFLLLICAGTTGTVGVATAAPTPSPAAPVASKRSALDLRQEDFRAVIARAKESIFPAVAYIRVVTEDAGGGRPRRRTASGSGVVVSDTGEVVTNWHVVEKAVEVRCLLNDGRAFHADIVGSDKDTDLALLRLRMKSGERVRAAKLAVSARPCEGDFVLALGAPWGLNRSVSFGIVSCARRYLAGTSEYNTWLQTDASISPGNSGGPLVDTNGHIIGINARGTTEGGTLAFAIPAETVALVVPRLRKHKEANWAWTGLQLQPLRDFERDIYFEGDSGVIVAGTDADSPARAAGALPNDRLLRVGGKPVRALMEEDLPAVRLRLALLPQGKPVVLDILRAGKPLRLTLTPRAKGGVEGAEAAFERWDFSAKAINKFESPTLYFERRSGVYVSAIRYPGNASDSQLSQNDILLTVNGRPVATLADLRREHKAALDKFAQGGPRRVLLTVLRNGQRIQVVLDFSRDYTLR